MRLSIDGRQRLQPGIREYAETKLARLERHASLHDLTLVLDREEGRIPEATAELIVHLHHTRFVVHAQGAGLREAIDAVVDLGDEQVRRRHDKVTSHKGHVGADAVSPKRRFTDGENHGADGVVHERRARLRPMPLSAALAEMERRDLIHLLYLDEGSGEVTLLARRRGGGFDLVVADLR